MLVALRKSFLIAILAGVGSVFSATGMSLETNVTEWNAVMEGADAGCAKECLKAVAPNATDFQEALFDCVQKCPMVKEMVKEKEATRASRWLGITSGVLGFVRLVPWGIRLKWDVPLCVAWARDPRWAKCWGATATIASTAFACASFSSMLISGPVVDVLKCVASGGSIALSLTQLGLDVWDLRYICASQTKKKEILSSVLNKMEKTLRVVEGSLRNDLNLTWEAFQSLEYEVNSLSNNVMNAENIATFANRMEAVAERLRRWESETHVYKDVGCFKEVGV